MSSKKTCVLLAAGFLFIFSRSVDGLSCYCDICTDSNYTCVTDGYCFTSISKDTNVIHDSLNNSVVKETEKQSHAISPEEKNTFAYHEAGHALISWLLPTTDTLKKVTHVPRTNAVLGFAQYTPTEGHLLSQQAVAEELLKKESLNYEEMVKLIGPPPNSEKRTVEMYEFNSLVDTKNTDSSKN